MYSKTNPRAGSLTTRQKRVFAIISAAFVLLLCGFGVWAPSAAMATAAQSTAGKISSFLMVIPPYCLADGLPKIAASIATFVFTSLIFAV